MLLKIKQQALIFVMPEFSGVLPLGFLPCSFPLPSTSAGISTAWQWQKGQGVGGCGDSEESRMERNRLAQISF